MSTFLQFHMLTVYPPSNLNRDDLGRPKTAMFGGTQRLRVSSQSLKRAWRTSEVFQSALEGHIGDRTQRLGEHCLSRLKAGGIEDDSATTIAREIAGVFGKLKKDGVRIEQLAHIGVDDRTRVNVLVDRAIAGETLGKDDYKALLGENTNSVDVSMFGRMLAASPAYNVEAACQVSHALSVHRVTVEDDFFTAVDDLKPSDEDVGAGMIGTSEFAASVLYTYICVSWDLLLENLGGDEALTGRALRALIEAATTTAPGGKQNSYASRARASYLLAERGSQQPRALSAAFLEDVRDTADILKTAIERLENERDNLDAVYGACADARCTMSVPDRSGSLKATLDFITATPVA